MKETKNYVIKGQGKAKDTAEKIFFRDNEHFAEVFNHTAFATAPIRAEELMTDDTDETAILKMTEHAHITLQNYRDVRKKLYEGKQLLMILGIEDQTGIDYQMPLRVMEMDFIHYARQSRQISDARKRGKAHLKAQGGAKSVSQGELISGFGKEDRLIPAVTQVIYYGTDPWNGPRSLSDMFLESPWAKYAQDYQMNLLEVNRITDEELDTYSADLKAFFGFVKYSKDKDKLRAFIEKNGELFQDITETTYDVIEEVTRSKELKEIKKKCVNKGGKQDMCVAITQIKEEGIKEGIEEHELKVYQNCIARGMSEEDARAISEYEGDPIQRIQHSSDL